MTPTKSESFATTINKVVNYCCKVLYLRCSWGPWLCLYFHVALSSYCNLLMLTNIENEPKKEDTITYNQHGEILSFLFLYPVTHPATNLLFYRKIIFGKE